MKFSNKVALLAAVAAACVPAMASARTQIRAVGSSTVYPFATAVAERLNRSNPGLAAPVIESTGTGAGFKLFCSGVGARFPDIANASRRIKASEVKQCAANGVNQITEIQIGIDGITLATAKGTPIADLSRRDVYAALAKTPWGKAQKARTWKDVNPKLPAIAIRVYGPPPTSGTRDAFNELMMTAGCETNAGMIALKKTDEAKYKAICTGIREDGAFIEAGENDNLIVQKLESNQNTLGLFGYSFLEENTDKLKGVSINGVAPSYQSIAGFKYPGSRPLYMYIKNAHARAIPAIKAYVTELSKETSWGPGGYLVRRGMIAAPEGVRSRSAAAARNLTPLDPASVK